MYAMATDSVSAEMRTKKIALLYATFGMSLTFGILATGLLFKYFGYVPAFFLSFGCSIFAIAIFYFVEDQGMKTLASLKTKMIELFSFRGLKESFKVVLKKRENRGRLKVILLCWASLPIGSFYSTYNDIQLYFCKKMYGWPLPFYTYVITVWDFCKYSFVFASVLLLNKILKRDDCRLGILGNISMLALSILTAFAYYEWMFYVALSLGISSTIPLMIIYAKLPKLVDDTELARVFSVICILDMLVTELSSLISTQVYKASIDYFPGLPVLIIAVVLIFPLAVFIWLIRIEKSQNQQQDFSNLDANDASASGIAQTES